MFLSQHLEEALNSKKNILLRAASARHCTVAKKGKVYCPTIHFREIENVQSNCELFRRCGVQAWPDLEQRESQSSGASRAGNNL